MKKILLATTLATGLTMGTTLPVFAASEEPVMMAQQRQQMRRSQAASQGDDVTEIRALLAGFSSAVLPGLGQWVFNEQRPKAVLHFLGAVALWSLPAFVPLPDPLGRLYPVVPTLFHLYSGYDAYTTAGGSVRIVNQPTYALQAWSFDQQVQAFTPVQPELSHLQLASSQLLD